MTDVVRPLAICEAPTGRAERCRRRAVYDVAVPGLGLRRLCGTHARFVRMHGALPRPPVLRPPRWTAEEDAAVRSHAGEPAELIASLLGRTRWAVYQRRATLKRGGRG